MFWLTFATPAEAGAWLRDEGAVFLSFGANVLLSEDTHVPVGRDPSLYLEWGYGPQTTLAFGINTGGRGDSRIAEFHVLRPLSLPERLGVATVSGGLALREFDSVQYDADGAETDQQDHLASLGLAWGQGSDAGWITAEGRVMADLADGDIEAKLDLTGGYHITPAWSAMVQLQSGLGQSGDDYGKLLPSVIYRVNDRLRINAGASHALTGDRGTGLFLAGWLDF